MNKKYSMFARNSLFSLLVLLLLILGTIIIFRTKAEAIVVGGIMPIGDKPVLELAESSVESEQILEPETIENGPVYFDVPLNKSLQERIFNLCEDYNVEPSIVIAIIEKESKYNASAIGDNGNSIGLMQIQPRWHQKRMDSLGCFDLTDPYQNVAVGINYLSELFETGNSVEWVLMAYNGGIAYANSNMSLGFVSEYARTVISISKSLCN